MPNVRVPSPPTGSTFADEFWAHLRVVVFAGFVAGVPVIGLGSRLIMLVLRLTSPDSVIGATSDDGFTIGDFTLGGTYNLMMMGMGLGLLGAAVYLAIKSLLIGPMWFRRLSTGVGSGVVVALDGHYRRRRRLRHSQTNMAGHRPVRLPSDRLRNSDRTSRRSDHRQLIRSGRRPPPMDAPARRADPFPLSWIIALVVAAVLAVWLVVRDSAVTKAARTPAARLVGQVGLVALAGLGFVALAKDIQSIV